MPIFVIAFLLGDVYLQTFSQLPSKTFLAMLMIASLLIYFLLRKQKRRWIFLPLGFIAGFTFAAWYAHSLFAFSLPQKFEGTPLLVIGYVASLPEVKQGYTHFHFLLQALPDGQKTNALIKLNCQDCSDIKVGEERQLLVKLKRIHGEQNPGTFDYEAWCLQKKLKAIGYVLKSPYNRIISHAWYRYPIEQIRQMLQARIQKREPHSTTSPWLMALMIGERNNIAAANWQVLRNTGTNHLMAIGGLHIGIVAGLAHTLFAWLWRRSKRLVLFFPAREAGALAALVTAILYSALAGFSIPTQRACIMFIVFMMTLLYRSCTAMWYPWSLALLIVLLCNPLSILTESFWLSFGTIALIIYGMSARLAPDSLWWKWGRVQWVIGIGLIPLTLFFFQECSLISCFANSIAIPWLGFFILPFCFFECHYLIHCTYFC